LAGRAAELHALVQVGRLTERNGIVPRDDSPVRARQRNRCIARPGISTCDAKLTHFRFAMKTTANRTAPATSASIVQFGFVALPEIVSFGMLDCGAKRNPPACNTIALSVAATRESMLFAVFLLPDAKGISLAIHKPQNDEQRTQPNQRERKPLGALTAAAHDIKRAR
jgi:hypothetical protein